jgi:hypothetical protein
VIKLRVAVNVIAYQCAWFACVLGAAAQRPAWGLAAAAAVVLWHLHTATTPWDELRLVAVAILTGAIFESLLAASGWVRMQPALMVALWAAFATTLNVSLRSLRPHYAWSAALAAVCAPLAYYGGSRLGALQWEDERSALLAIAIGWAVLMPMLMKTAQRFDGFAPA